MNSSKNSF